MSMPPVQFSKVPNGASFVPPIPPVIARGGRDQIVSLAKLVIDHALQPIVEINTFQIHGYEVLMRGYDRLGLSSPIQLLDHAAESGNLVRLEAMLFERAMAKFASASNRAGKKLFLNLDGRALSSAEEFIPVMAETAQEHGLALSDICIELSERYNHAAMPAFSQIAEELRGLGVRTAIDDFGVGFSQLRLLCDHSVDYVKIDGHFIRGIAESHRKRLFVGIVTKLAHELGSCVVAEGVETEADFLICREAGCDLVQGYFVARPTTDMRELASGEGRRLAA
jgi:EAL domain-containing protein (putative c-di-GMP-specific phosphodiesterase class I)